MQVLLLHLNLNIQNKKKKKMFIGVNSQQKTKSTKLVTYFRKKRKMNDKHAIISLLHISTKYWKLSTNKIHNFRPLFLLWFYIIVFQIRRWGNFDIRGFVFVTTMGVFRRKIIIKIVPADELGHLPSRPIFDSSCCKQKIFRVLVGLECHINRWSMLCWHTHNSLNLYNKFMHYLLSYSRKPTMMKEELRILGNMAG